MSSASLGADAERRVRRVLEDLDYLVVRAAASKGCADLLAIRPGGGVLLIQVKRGAGRMRPREWNELLEVARRYGALPVLAEFVPRQGIAWWWLTGPKAVGGRGRQPYLPYSPKTGGSLAGG